MVVQLEVSFVALLVVATFIDFEHFIIPDQITIGGTVAGLVASLVVPELMNTDSRLAAVIRSALAAALGYLTLLIVLEAGKKAFGRKRIVLEKPTPFFWKRQGEDADFVVGDERSLWSEYFVRETDRLVLHCNEGKIDQRNYKDVTLQFHYNRVAVEGEELLLDQIDEISGVVRELQIPREAMGRGDLKFLAAIGAFLGWRAVLFSIFAGSLLGSLVGLVTIVLGKRLWSAKLPFGPYLAFGALTWMFFGPAFIRWYVGLMTP
jgi:leader peptidase (prepilin peptidase)/N-methyltransferase